MTILEVEHKLKEKQKTGYETGSDDEPGKWIPSNAGKLDIDKMANSTETDNTNQTESSDIKPFLRSRDFGNAKVDLSPSESSDEELPQPKVQLKKTLRFQQESQPPKN